MISYHVVHHVSGRIRLKVPFLRKLAFVSLTGIPDHIKNFSFISLPTGIKDIRPNPLTGSLVIEYEPDEVNIMEFIQSALESIAVNKEIQEILKKLP